MLVFRAKTGQSSKDEKQQQDLGVARGSVFLFRKKILYVKDIYNRN